jgi:hypothetical protein
LRRIGLHELLPGQRTLLTGIPDFFPPLGSLRRRKTPQLAIFATLQGAFSPQLLARVDLLLPLRPQVGLSLRAGHVGLRLRGWCPLALPFCAQLLPLNVPLLLDLPLLLLDAPVDHRRCLMALGRRKIWPRDIGC